MVLSLCVYFVLFFCLKNCVDYRFHIENSEKHKTYFRLKLAWEVFSTSCVFFYLFVTEDFCELEILDAFARSVAASSKDIYFFGLRSVVK